MLLTKYDESIANQARDKNESEEYKNRYRYCSLPVFAEDLIVSTIAFIASRRSSRRKELRRRCVCNVVRDVVIRLSHRFIKFIIVVNCTIKLFLLLVASSYSFFPCYKYLLSLHHEDHDVATAATITMPSSVFVSFFIDTFFSPCSLLASYREYFVRRLIE